MRRCAERIEAHRWQSFFITVNPVIWLTMLMRHGKYDNVVFLDRIQQLVREFMQQTFPDVAAFKRPD